MKNPVGYLLGFARGWLPPDVVESNRRKLLEATGGYPGGGADVVRLTEDPFPDVNVVLALSGGGMRAANLAAAVILELSRVPLEDAKGRPITLLDTVDSVSTVSGGSIATAFYLYHRNLFAGNARDQDMRLHRELIEDGLRRNFERPLILSVLLPHKISTWVRLLTYASRTNLFSSMIEYDVIRPQRLEKLEKKVLARGWRRNRWIIGPADVFTTVISFASPINLPDQYLLPGRGHTLGERYLQDPKDPRALFPMRPEWLINATVYNETPEANAFLFDEKTFNRYRSDWMNYRVSNAVAASAAFPVLFAPVSWRDWSSKAPSWLFLLDGGVSDNLGLNGVKLAMGRSNAPRASVVILVDAFTREGRVVRRKSDRPSVVEVSARALDRYMFVTRAQAIKEWKEKAAREGFTFVHLSIDPKDATISEMPEDVRRVFTEANRIETRLRISREEQNTLFEAARVLVGRERDTILRAIREGTAAGAARDGAGPVELHGTGPFSTGRVSPLDDGARGTQARRTRRRAANIAPAATRRRDAGSGIASCAR